jgi:hypothetical protein
MPYELSNIHVCVSEMENQPGGLAGVLEDLSVNGINLEFVVGRRQPDRPGKGLVFVAPVTGAAQIRAAKKAGFAKAESMHSIRIIGPDKAGLGARMTRVIADADINLRGVTAASIGRKCLVYFAFDSKDDAKKGMRELKKLLG